MFYLLAGVAALGLLLWLASNFANSSPEQVRKVLVRVGIGLGALILLWLLATGRGGQLLTFGFVLIPLAMRWWRRRKGAAGFEPGGGSSAGRVSRVATDSLSMELDHDSGRMTGSVTRGAFRGRDLGSMDLADLLTLWSDLRQADAASLPLLETWLDRIYPDNWRDAADRVAAGTEPQSAPASGPLSRVEAFAILGLPEDASREAIAAAHKRLMRQFHPDLGGSSWLAARINQARDLLLGD